MRQKQLVIQMERNSNVIEELNDLILINNDRVAGYEKALKEVDPADRDLAAIFRNQIGHSRTFVQELSDEVVAQGGEPTTGTMVSGKLYRFWMDIKNAIKGDRRSVLESCEFGEDAAQKAYDEALKSKYFSADLRLKITNQKATLRVGHDTIKRKRDVEKATYH
jgi:uncharacterized protein (TIGR02284 family)